MRAPRTLAALAAALLLAGGLADPRPTLAYSAHAVPVGGYIFAGARDGLIYRSADGGASWVGAGPEINFDTVYSLAVAPDGTTVYAGTESHGLWAGADNGTSWQPAGGSGEGAIPEDERVVGVAVDPLDGRHLFAVSEAGTLYESTDGAQSWSARTLPHVCDCLSEVSRLALDPQRPSTLLVGTRSGLLVSTDGGGTWTAAAGVPDAYVDSLAFDPRRADLAYAASGGLLYRSADGGRSWQPRVTPLARSVGAVAVDPSGVAGVLAGSSSAAIARSRDGLSWRRASTPDRWTDPIVAFAFDPARPGRVLAALLDGGVLVSTDSGGSWQATDGPGDLDHLWCLATTPPTTPLPSSPVGPPGDLVHARYFPSTRHTLREPFLYFWDRHGNLPLFGFPLTEPFVEDGQTVQYFERARLAYAGGKVTVSPLGLAVTAGRYFPPPPAKSSGARLTFPGTGHTLAAPFLAYWQRHEGGLVIGPPISEPLREQNGDGSGRTYLVQYFRNMRLEYHPELSGTPYVVSAGLLGRQYLHQRGWI